MARPRKLDPAAQARQDAVTARLQEINARELAARGHADEILEQELKPAVREALAGEGIPELRLATALDRDRRLLRRWADST
jgi:hypothetical protein